MTKKKEKCLITNFTLSGREKIDGMNVYFWKTYKKNAGVGIAYRVPREESKEFYILFFIIITKHKI